MLRFPVVQPALDATNQAFHSQYDGALEEAKLLVPMLIVLADELILRLGEDRTVLRFTPEVFHALKSASHAPIAIFAILTGASKEVATQVSGAFAARLQAADEELNAYAGHAEAVGAGQSVLRACLQFLKTRPQAPADKAALTAFGVQLRPALEQLSVEATRVQLAGLHAGATRLLATLKPDEALALQVIVTGDHQARSRSLAMQYFQKRLQDPPGRERIVTYGEGLSTEAEAMQLAAKRAFDRQIARVFFGDEHRLQRDVLGDAAKGLLSDFDLNGNPDRGPGKR